MPVIIMPTNWERSIVAVMPDGDCWLVRFECGHEVWFAIDVTGWKQAHCSVCFDKHMRPKPERKA